MFVILRATKKPRFTSDGRAWTLVIARCLKCGGEREMLERSVALSNRLKTAHCVVCVKQTSAYERKKGVNPR